MTRVVEPPWLTAKVDQLLAKMKDHGASADMFAAMGTGVVMVFLTEPAEGSTRAEQNAWDKTCDNCGAYAGGEIHPGAVMRKAFGVEVQINFGVCGNCAKGFEKEGS